MIRKIYGFGAEKSHKKTEKIIFIGGLILLTVFLVLQLAARKAPGFGEWYAQTIYPLLTGSIGRICGLLSFSVGEVLLYLMLLLCLIYGITHLKQWKKILNRTFFLVSVLLFLFTINCGINYYRRPFSQFLNYGAGQYSAQDLEELLNYLTVQVNSAKERQAESGRDTAAEKAAEGAAAMKKLGGEYPALSGFYPRPKKLLLPRVLSVQQLTGIYSPFTIEANYNGEMTPYNIPHTICHELSHLRGFMREDEANFIGVLACIGSENAGFQYSGYLTGWIYAGNALAAEDADSYYEYWDKLDESVRRELRENSLFWERFNTKTAEFSEAVNDTYLKANSQPDGVKSYGRAVDLLLAWYHQ